MTTYRLYAENGRLLAIPADSELDPTQDGASLVGLVEAMPFRAFSPTSSAFQRDQTNEYIKTGMDWPMAEAVVVH